MYRGRARRCPGCGAMMREVVFSVRGEDAQVDVCPDCGGAFIEFFDGEPVGVARAAVAASDRPASMGAKREADHKCPDCQLELERDAYLDTGPTVSRCGECMALFATRDELARLAIFAETERDEDEDAEPTWWDRLVTALMG